MRSYWENIIYVVKEQINDSPVYKVASEVDVKRTRVLHCNVLHFNDLPADIPVENQRTRTSPEKRKRPKSTSIETKLQSDSETDSEEGENSVYYELRYNLRDGKSRAVSPTDELICAYSQSSGDTEVCAPGHYGLLAKERDLRHMRRAPPKVIREQRGTKQRFFLH